VIYCETSVIVAALGAGPDSERLQDWLAAQDVGGLCISQLVMLEFESALNQMLRRGLITLLMRGKLASILHTIAGETFHTIEITDQAIFQAQVRLRGRGTELGTMDALHLAIASQGRHTFATVDPVLAKAAEGWMDFILV
jgi:predicted nucleic acid-binding protein